MFYRQNIEFTGRRLKFSAMGGRRPQCDVTRSINLAWEHRATWAMLPPPWAVDRKNVAN